MSSQRGEADIWILPSPVMILLVPPFVDFQNLYFPCVLTQSYHRLGKIIYGEKMKHDCRPQKQKQNKQKKPDCSQALNGLDRME